MIKQHFSSLHKLLIVRRIVHDVGDAAVVGRLQLVLDEVVRNAASRRRVTAHLLANRPTGALIHLVASRVAVELASTLQVLFDLDRVRVVVLWLHNLQPIGAAIFKLSLI